ncbi:phosphatase PAP2 family protein [Nakamurella panacisegetis]|uniref:phosphatase PAP2 family protein n=1 Tax=Nakamurella panacisegetis TaxID=1090615 RepID=UPI0012FDE8E0|nr:phosphatase PAP2 family protein [Nakamurella panacisegetis]
MTAVYVVVAYVAVTLVWTGLGLLLTGPLAHTGVVRTDHDVLIWFVQHRTAAGNQWTKVGSMMGQTLVKVIVAVAATAIALAVYRRWREPLLIAGAIVLEGFAFLTITHLVGRPRPDVPALDPVTVMSSFPSGHTAAGAAYSAIAVVLLERFRATWARIVTVVLALTVPVLIGLSRVYRGVHNPTDVLGGAALGLACVAIMYLIVRHTFGPGAGPTEQAAAMRTEHPVRGPAPRRGDGSAQRLDAPVATRPGEPERVQPGSAESAL